MLRALPLAIVVCFATCHGPACAQTALDEHAAAPGSVPTGALVNASSPKQCTFHYLPANPGDQYHQHVHYQVDLATQMHQSGQVISDAKQIMHSQQKRHVKILPRRADGGSTVEVRFDQAQQQVGRAPDKLQKIHQPINGKSYRVSRDSQQRLTVVSTRGKPVTPEEAQMVELAMQSVGRPNPLGLFLNGKTLQIGQQIELPENVAADLFSASPQSKAGKKIGKFLLTLREIRTDQDRNQSPSALFNITIEMATEDASTTPTTIGGHLVLDIQSSRAVSTQIEGPVHITEQRGPKQASFTVEGRGVMRMASSTRYQTRNRTDNR